MRAVHQLIGQPVRVVHVAHRGPRALTGCFETDASPDLANGNYLVIKRPMRGIAAWFENPAYRAEAGDYIVTADGKLVGIMIDRE